MEKELNLKHIVLLCLVIELWEKILKLSKPGYEKIYLKKSSVEHILTGVALLVR